MTDLGPLFARVQQVQWPAPVAPGSVTSQRAAESITRLGKRQKSLKLVLKWFAAQSVPRTRYELADALFKGRTGPACGRVSEAKVMGWLEVVSMKGRRETLRLTASGRKAGAA